MVSIHKTINLDYETMKIAEELQAKGINISELIREFLKKYKGKDKGDDNGKEHKNNKSKE